MYIKLLASVAVVSLVIIAISLHNWSALLAADYERSIQPTAVIQPVQVSTLRTLTGPSASFDDF